MSRTVLTLFALAVVSLAACPEDSDPQVQPDATADASSPDAEVDASSVADAGATDVPAAPDVDPPDSSDPDAVADTDTGAPAIGPVVEIAVRRLVPGQAVTAFESARDTFVAALKQQPGVGTDRELEAFLDFGTFAPPEPPVFIGMTQYDDLDAFAAAGQALGTSPEAGAFFGTFTPLAFTALTPLDPATPVDLAAIAPQPGQVLEVAVRDLSMYDGFDATAYAQARDAFLTLLGAQSGVVAEYQWVSVLDPNIVVGMTVYDDPAAFGAVSTGIGTAAETAAFLGGYPPMAGFATMTASTEPDPTSDGVLEIAVRRLNEGQDLSEFEAARDAFVALLTAQPGVGTDREFEAFVDFGTMAPPTPPVFVGMTQYESQAAYEAAGAAIGTSAEAATFFGTFSPEAFDILQPLTDGEGIDLAAMAAAQGRVLEVAVRDLSTYADFDPAAYATARDDFLDLLTAQPGVITEYQWVSATNPDLVVGMTVYADQAAFAAINSDPAVLQAPETAAFLFAYPAFAGFANTVVK